MEIIFIPNILLLFKILCPSQALCKHKMTEDWTTTHNFSGYLPLFTFPLHTVYRDPTSRPKFVYTNLPSIPNHYLLWLPLTQEYQIGVQTLLKDSEIQ